MSSTSTPARTAYNPAAFNNVGTLASIDTKKLFFKPIPDIDADSSLDIVFSSIYYYSDNESHVRYNVPFKVILKACTIMRINHDEKFDRFELSLSLTDDEIQKLGSIARQLQTVLVKRSKPEDHSTPPVEDVKIFNRCITVRAPQVMRNCHVIFTKSDGQEMVLNAGLPAEYYFKDRIDANGETTGQALIPEETVADIVLQISYYYSRKKESYAFGVWPTGIRTLTGHRLPVKNEQH